MTTTAAGGTDLEYFQGLTRRQLEDARRVFIALGGCALSILADELEAGVAVDDDIDVIVCLARGRVIKIKTLKSKTVR